MPTNVLVVYYSAYGHLFKMAQAVEAGAKSVADTDVRLRRVAELEDARKHMSQQPPYVQAQEAQKDVAIATNDDLHWDDD